MSWIYEGTYALEFQNVAVGSINRGFLQGYDYTRGDFSGFVTNPTHFGTELFLLLYTQMRNSEIKTSTGYGSVNSKRAHPPWEFVILFWKSWSISSVNRQTAWENSRHLATLPLVSPPNDLRETSADIPYQWSVTTQIWVVRLIGRDAWEIWFNQSEALPRSG